VTLNRKERALIESVDPPVEHRRDGRATDTAELVWLVVIFAAALWALVHALGTSPHAFIDTDEENVLVDDCLVRSRCTIVGPGATIGIFHSAGYLHWRALLTWVGLNPNGQFCLLLMMGALGVGLVAIVARRAEGPLAAAIASGLMLTYLGAGMQVDVITDVAPVPFLGAVFLLVAWTAVARPSLWLTALMGMVGGVMSNVYATGVLCGLSSVLVTLLLPRRRSTHAGVALASFGATTFIIAPATWVVDLHVLFTYYVGNGNPVTGRHFFDVPVVRLTTCTVILGGLAAVIGGREARRRLFIPASIFVPLYVPLALGSFVGRLDPQDKYCAHVLPGVCVAMGIAFVTVLRTLWDSLSSWWPRLGAMNPVWSRASRLSPYGVVAVMLAGGCTWGWTGAPPLITFHDVASVERILVSEHGWSWARAARNLKTPDDAVRHAMLRWAKDWPDGSDASELERAYLLKVPADRLPQTPSPDTVVVSSTRSDATLLALTCGWIDWSSFRVCVKSPLQPEECTPSALPTEKEGPPPDHWPRVPGMPGSDGSSLTQQSITLELPLKPRAQCPEDWIYMPRTTHLCPGHIVSVDGRTSEISESGTWARLRWGDASAGSAPKMLVVQWDTGGADCWSQYRGYPPFFLEGAPDSVTRLKALLDSPRPEEFGEIDLGARRRPHPPTTAPAAWSARRTGRRTSS
jgi:hypothetical protein